MVCNVKGLHIELFFPFCFQKDDDNNHLTAQGQQLPEDIYWIMWNRSNFNFIQFMLSYILDLLDLLFSCCKLLQMKQLHIFLSISKQCSISFIPPTNNNKKKGIFFFNLISNVILASWLSKPNLWLIVYIFLLFLFF